MFAKRGKYLPDHTRRPETEISYEAAINATLRESIPRGVGVDIRSGRRARAAGRGSRRWPEPRSLLASRPVITIGPNAPRPIAVATPHAAV